MGKKTESEKNVERQNLRNVYEPEIRAMEANITSLTTEIEFLTMKKIFLDSNVTTLDTTHQNFRDLMNTNKNKFNEIDTEDLKGNYMVQVNAQASAVIGMVNQQEKRLNERGTKA